MTPYRQPYLNNPGEIDAGIALLKANNAFTGRPAHEHMIGAALVRIIGGSFSDYVLLTEPHDGIDVVDSQEATFLVHLFDLGGQYVLVALNDRGLAGSCHAVIEDLWTPETTVGKIIDDLCERLGVNPGQVTLTVTEDAYGLGRIEWSVVQ